jgi:hypothetical protein
MTHSPVVCLTFATKPRYLLRELICIKVRGSGASDCNDDPGAIAILTIGMGEAPSMEHNRRRAERSIDANQGPSGAFPHHGARS